MHVFYVQGGGLGHLTRVDKLITTLKIPKNTVKIITPSCFTHYFKDYKFAKLSWSNTPMYWTKQVIAIIKETNISAFYIDTFPLGIKNELAIVYNTFPNLNYIYISRVLKWEPYIKTVSIEQSIVFTNTIVLEQLYTTHLNWIKLHSVSVTNLSLKSVSVTPIAFMDTPYIMVVHSGGKDDVLKICNKAIEDNKANKNSSIIVFTQVDIKLNDERVIMLKNVYPVSKYYEYANKIYTAAGFNSVQELQFYKEKHVVIPLGKLFDDQFFRHSQKETN